MKLENSKNHFEHDIYYCSGSGNSNGSKGEQELGGFCIKGRFKGNLGFDVSPFFKKSNSGVDDVHRRY